MLPYRIAPNLLCWNGLKTSSGKGTILAYAEGKYVLLDNAMYDFAVAVVGYIRYNNTRGFYRVGPVQYCFPGFNTDSLSVNERCTAF